MIAVFSFIDPSLAGRACGSLAGLFFQTRLLHDLGNADTEVIVDDYHIALGNALAVDEQIHLIACQLVQHQQRTLGELKDLLYLALRPISTVTCSGTPKISSRFCACSLPRALTGSISSSDTGLVLMTFGSGGVGIPCGG